MIMFITKSIEVIHFAEKCEELFFWQKKKNGSVFVNNMFEISKSH